MHEPIYFKGKNSAIISSNNDFIYEVCIFCRFPKYYGLMDRVFYRSSKPIRTFIPVQSKKHYIVTCSLYAAPKLWLLNNEFELFVKKTKIKPKKDGTQNVPNIG